MFLGSQSSCLSWRHPVRMQGYHQQGLLACRIWLPRLPPPALWGMQRLGDAPRHSWGCTAAAAALSAPLHTVTSTFALPSSVSAACVGHLDCCCLALPGQAAQGLLHITGQS